jgi:hypothetical protein
MALFMRMEWRLQTVMKMGREILLIGADEADGLYGALLDAECALDARVGLDDERLVFGTFVIESDFEYVGLRRAAIMTVAAADTQVFVHEGVLMCDFHE